MFSFNCCFCNINFSISITMLLMCHFKYIHCIFPSHQFINSSVSPMSLMIMNLTFNIPSFTHLLLNYILINHAVILFIQFLSCFYKFISNQFYSVYSIILIIYFQLYYIVLLIAFIIIIHFTLHISNTD